MNEQIKAFVSSIVSIVVIGAGILGIAIDPDAVATVVYAVAIIAVIIWDIWTNHNFTAAAAMAQKIIDALKQGALTEGEVAAFIEEHIHKKQ